MQEKVSGLFIPSGVAHVEIHTELTFGSPPKETKPDRPVPD